MKLLSLSLRLVSLVLAAVSLAGVLYHLILHQVPACSDLVLHGSTLITVLLALFVTGDKAGRGPFVLALSLVLVLIGCTSTTVFFFLRLDWSGETPDPRPRPHVPYKTCCSSLCGVYNCLSVSLVDGKELEVAVSDDEPDNSRAQFLVLAGLTVSLELVAFLALVCRIRSVNKEDKDSSGEESPV